MKKKSNAIRCSICGRFIGHLSFHYEQVHIDFVPDTAFTIENIDYQHKVCYNKEKEKDNVDRS